MFVQEKQLGLCESNELHALLTGCILIPYSAAPELALESKSPFSPGGWAGISAHQEKPSHLWKGRNGTEILGSPVFWELSPSDLSPSSLEVRLTF